MQGMLCSCGNANVHRCEPWIAPAVSSDSCATRTHRTLTDLSLCVACGESSLPPRLPSPSRSSIPTHLTQLATRCAHVHPQARVVYARSGTRFAGVGEGGVVALWRQDLAPSARGLGFADWVHHVSA